MLFKHHLLSSTLLSFVLCSTFSFAQMCKVLEFSKISVNLIYNDPEISPSESLLLKSMVKALKEKNLFAPYDEKSLDYIFLVNAKEYQRNSKREILASIIVFAKIPDKVVEIGAREEAFYKVLGDTTMFNISEIGRKVRKLMSADYMRNFGEVVYQFLEIVHSDKIDMFCQSAVTKFLAGGKKK